MSINSKISIICCYRNSEAWEDLQRSLDPQPNDNIEFIGIDNRQNKFTLPQAYNLGKTRAQGIILVFVHDDVEFLHKEWIHPLRNLFDDDTVGAVGCAGGTNFFNAPSTWWFKKGQNIPLRNMQEGSKTDVVIYRDSNYAQEVFCLDGFILICRKDQLEDFQWSDEIGHWHGYDLDFSLYFKLKKKARNILFPMVFVRHASRGTVNEDWAMSMIAVWKKYEHELSATTSQQHSTLALLQFINWTHTYPKVGVLLRRRLKESKRHLLGLVLSRAYSNNIYIKKTTFKALDIWAKFLQRK